MMQYKICANVNGLKSSNLSVILLCIHIGLAKMQRRKTFFSYTPNQHNMAYTEQVVLTIYIHIEIFNKISCQLLPNIYLSIYHRPPSQKISMERVSGIYIQHYIIVYIIYSHTDTRMLPHLCYLEVHRSTCNMYTSTPIN